MLAKLKHAYMQALTHMLCITMHHWNIGQTHWHRHKRIRSAMTHTSQYPNNLCISVCTCPPGGCTLLAASNELMSVCNSSLFISTDRGFRAPFSFTSKRRLSKGVWRDEILSLDNASWTETERLRILVYRNHCGGGSSSSMVNHTRQHFTPF